MDESFCFPPSLPCPVGQNDRTGVECFLFLLRSMLHAPCLLLHWGEAYSSGVSEKQKGNLSFPF